MMNRKGMSAALTLVITIVVLIVVALALITITTENVAQTGGSTRAQNYQSSCDIWKKTACSGRGTVNVAFQHPGIPVATAGGMTCTCTCTTAAASQGTQVKCDGV